MEYSPRGALPIVSWADAGAVEFIRGLGAEVVSSGDLFQVVAAAWDDDATASHHAAVTHVMELHELGRAHALGSTEAGLAQRILDEIARRGLDHRARARRQRRPQQRQPAPRRHGRRVIGPGQVLMLDLWARLPGARTVFGDVTWMSFTGAGAPAAGPGGHGRRRRRPRRGAGAARRHGAARLRARPRRRERHRGRRLRPRADAPHRATRSDRGRTSTVSAPTSTTSRPTTTARLLPGTGFTVEPGVYLPEFGVRLECNVHLHPQRGAQVTTPAADGDRLSTVRGRWPPRFQPLRSSCSPPRAATARASIERFRPSNARSSSTARRSTCARRSSTTSTSWRSCASAGRSSSRSSTTRSPRAPSPSSPPTASRRRSTPTPRPAACGPSTPPARWSPRSTARP